VAVIDSISASFNWHCAKVGFNSPFLNKRIVLIVMGIKRLLRMPTVPRLPFLSTHIRRFMRFSKGSSRHWRAVVVMATCFADFLRFSKVLNIRLEDLTLAGNDLRFRVRKAKNHRLGFDVCLPVGAKSIRSFVLDFPQRGLKWRPGKIGFLGCQLEGGNFRPSYPSATLRCTLAAKISLRRSAWIQPNTLRIRLREVQPWLQSWQAVWMLR
jgi:hypothetical protein